MPIIGLTGSFGAGKSTVAAIFRSFGARIIDADRIAHSVISKGSSRYDSIVRIFGSGILNKTGDIDRKKLGRIAFGNKTLTARLNGIIHPEVIRIIRSKLSKSKRSEVIVIDAPLLVEAGLHKVADKIVVVHTPQKVQIERCVAKFGIDKEDVLTRIGHQVPIKKKIALADFVIDNGSTRSLTRRQARKVWREIIWK